MPHAPDTLLPLSHDRNKASHIQTLGNDVVVSTSDQLRFRQQGKSKDRELSPSDIHRHSNSTDSSRGFYETRGSAPISMTTTNYFMLGTLSALLSCHILDAPTFGGARGGHLNERAHESMSDLR
jgi:hypothetical protein